MPSVVCGRPVHPHSLIRALLSTCIRTDLSWPILFAYRIIWYCEIYRSFIEVLNILCGLISWGGLGVGRAWRGGEGLVCAFRICSKDALYKWAGAQHFLQDYMTLISLRIHTGWSESSLSVWYALDPWLLTEYGQRLISLLIWVFAGRTCIFVRNTAPRLKPILSHVLSAWESNTKWSFCSILLCSIRPVNLSLCNQSDSLYDPKYFHVHTIGIFTFATLIFTN